ncbi:MAG TPA: hypothetical protein VI729_12465 [Anaerolineales bacterium]|nr:hypothetical protein [Anaerolineales bacterium]
MNEQGLTPQEVLALVGIASGLSISETSRRLRISRGTLYRRLFTASGRVGCSGTFRRGTLIARAVATGAINPYASLDEKGRIVFLAGAGLGLTRNEEVKMQRTK